MKLTLECTATEWERRPCSTIMQHLFMWLKRNGAEVTLTGSPTGEDGNYKPQVASLYGKIDLSINIT